MKHLLEQIIKEWWLRPLPNIVNRDIDLQEFLNIGVNKIVTVTGFRRVGKTYLLLELAKKLGQDNCVYINFEDERLPKDINILTVLLDVITEMSGNKGFTLLLDEIQNIPGWSVWARRVNETTPHRLVITGSSSKLSSFELPTELRGRSLEVRVFALNFKEFLKFKHINAKDVSKPLLQNLVREFIMYGGFPEIVLVEEGKKYILADEYFKTFVQRDVLERHRIRQEDTLRNLLNLMLNSTYYTIGKVTKNLLSIQGTASKVTTSRFLTYLEESFFLHSLYLHTPSVKNRLRAERKCYFVDNIFIARSSKFSQNLGRLLEQTVYGKLIQTFFASGTTEIFYWKDHLHHEVDFVVREKEEIKELIQVSYVSTKTEIADREISALIKAGKSLKCNDLTVITWDYSGEYSKNELTVKFVPIVEWLLNVK